MCWHRATIVSRWQVSPMVTGLTLRLQPNGNKMFTFTPGQWVDFKPLSKWKDNNGGKNIGGYSITSIPQSLPQIDLAIKTSTHPVAEWVTSNAKPNDIVDIRVGGTFTYKTEEYNPSSRIHNNNNKLLFIAGGVGINPLFSMIQQWHLDETKKRGNGGKSRAVLLYSGGRMEDLLFLDQLEKLVKDSSDQLHVICTTTQQSEHKSDRIARQGRIDLELIRGAATWLNRYEKADNEKVEEVFLCGPPGMSDSITELLVEEKIVQSRNNIHFERWW